MASCRGLRKVGSIYAPTPPRTRWTAHASPRSVRRSRGCYNPAASQGASGAGRRICRMWRTNLALALAPRVASGYIRVQRRLMRFTWVNEEAVLSIHRAGRSYVHAFFHDQLLMMTYSYLGARFGRRLAVLASRHRDGEYVARTLERFGHLLVRGSSGRGGAGGLRQMVRHLRGGLDGAIAVDGPRGPRHEVQMGVVEAARLGGASIVP